VPSDARNFRPPRAAGIISGARIVLAKARPAEKNPRTFAICACDRPFAAVLLAGSFGTRFRPRKAMRCNAANSHDATRRRMHRRCEPHFCSVFLLRWKNVRARLLAGKMPRWKSAAGFRGSAGKNISAKWLTS
jgi:hypothetical protein